MLSGKRSSYTTRHRAVAKGVTIPAEKGGTPSDPNLFRSHGRGRRMPMRQQWPAFVNSQRPQLIQGSMNQLIYISQFTQAKLH